MNKRRICCFCERWASGGIESFLFNLLQQADLSELEVDVVAARLERNNWSAQLEAKGVQFIPLTGSLRNVPGNRRKFRLLLRQRQYDVVHLNLYQGLSLNYARLARQEGVPVRIAHSHNAALRPSPTRGLKLLLHRWGRKRFTKDATNLWACSQAAADFLFARPASFVPNGVDTRHFRFDAAVRDALRRQLGLTGCLVLGNVGRLCRQKNQAFLLEIFAQLVQRHRNSRLLLVGEGEDRDKLKSRAKDLGIEQQILFYGRTRQVERLLWAMDVFLLPSLFEGLPLAAVEAQAAGLPVLCAEGLSPEIRVTEHLQFLPLAAGAKVWADRILELASRNSREQAAVEVSRAGFDVRSVARRIMSVYSGRDEDATEDLGHCSGVRSGGVSGSLSGQHPPADL